MKTSLKYIAAAAALALGSAGMAWAQLGSGGAASPGTTQATGQDTAPGMHRPGRGDAHGSRHGQGRRMPTAAEVSARLDTLKAELKITPEQAPAWQQFADTARTQAEARAARRAQMQAQWAARRQAKQDGATAAAPTAAPPADRSALRAQMKQQLAADKAARDSARSALYAVLSPEQKALADQKLRGPRGEGRGEGRGHGHRHGGMAGAADAG